MTEKERELKAILRLSEAIHRNKALIGRTGIVAYFVARHIAGPGRRVGGYTEVRCWEVAARAGVSRQQATRVINAMVADGLVARERRAVAVAPGEVRTVVYLKSMVGEGLVVLLRAISLWEVDWTTHDPRPDHGAVACPGCGS